MYHEISPYNSYLRQLAFTFARDKDNAQDLYQETVYKALAKFYQFKPGTNLKAWLSTIMRNTFINEYRKKKFYTTPIETIQTTTCTPTEVNYSLSNLSIEEINNEMSSLNPKYKSVIEMCIAGFSYEEIAAHLNLPLGTVKSRIHLGRKELRDKLRESEILN